MVRIAAERDSDEALLMDLQQQLRIIVDQLGRDPQVSSALSHDIRLTDRRSELEQRFLSASTKRDQSRMRLQYAQDRVESMEKQVANHEKIIQGYRTKMKERDLLPPALPRELLYLDPDSVPLEDLGSPRSDGAGGAPVSAVGEPEMENSAAEVPDERPMLPDDQIGLTESEMYKVNGILDEMRPVIERAVEEAMEKYRRSGG
ncbi:hypothetical protein AMK24_11365 [Streptomyces sp. CB02366]|nr:hypothetical protein AMK24_11365 [Streptomyces sp. CB02366]